MDHIGMDVHKKESQLCILTEAGEVIERRVRSEPGRFAAVLGGPRHRRGRVPVGAMGRFAEEDLQVGADDRAPSPLSSPLEGKRAG